VRAKVGAQVGRMKWRTTRKPSHETTNSQLKGTLGNIGTTRAKSGRSAGHGRPEGQQGQERDDKGTEGRTVATLLGLRERECVANFPRGL
jgi:hypothetical protein